jgi:hypothetical protein
MDKTNMFYQWGNEYLPWLYRREMAGDTVLPGDLNLILLAEPEAFGDPLMKDYLLPSLRSELRLTRGRKKLGSARRLSLLLAHWDIQEGAEEIRQARRSGTTPRCRSDLSPLLQAADEVAEDWSYRLGTGRSILNQLSAHRNPPRIAMNENSARV